MAQTWPAARPVTMVVPFPPGPALDLVARLVGGKISDALGQTVVVENRSGANGTIGSSLVARATPDGYTLLAATAGTHVTAVHLMKHLPYDPLKDFAPIVAAVEPVTCLAVHSAVPVDTVEELIAYARSHPDELSYGSSGLGSVFHMMGELFNQTAGVRIKHVPYRGVAPAMQDVISGHIPMVFISVSNAIPAMQTGRVKILAVLEPTRYPKLSQVRSMSEIVSAFQKPSSWFGFFGPAGLPREIVTRLNIEMVKSLNASDVRGKLEDNGMTVIGGTPEQFGALMQDGIVRYGAIIKATGIQAE
ncbi:MAG TPA: tripartite tricarboxylate transporter substrate binding protein [Xanthobacteraceae bacterium]|nr:tripartite tricarboxylate transporter substrate binding protein [Xanthobacteraceae bacterium]